MRIVELREVTLPIASAIANACVENGCVPMPNLPAIGFAGKFDLIKGMRQLAD